MRIRSFFLFCFLFLPVVAWGVDIEISTDTLQDNYGGAVVPPEMFGGGAKTGAASSAIPDLLNDDYNDDDRDTGIADPLEGWNRMMFHFNDKMYVWVLKPTTDVYKTVLPADIRGCVDNFFLNLSTPVRMVNALFQGRFKDAGTELSRFVINTTIGVAGLADVAEADFGIARRRADFGQTLGHYGVGGGIFICWPILGPSTLRDSVGMAVDIFANPTTYIDKTTGGTIGVNAAQMVNKLSISPDVMAELKKMSFDPYIAMRQGYVDYRRALIESSGSGQTSTK
ncbi:MAG TPA: VacJ family lipoprotein [Desulfobulbaceae bacterium]|nr:VacJ family lipoprotein [Desulfobulbaceae bacterium]